jgi:hypothetical protein
VNATAPLMPAATVREKEPRAILFGRFMLPDSTEHPCQVSELSPDGAVFLTSIAPPVGLSIVAYIDEIGRLEAVTDAPVEGGFAVSFQISGPRRERIESRIRMQLGDTDVDDGIQHRRHVRHDANSASHITLPDGRVYPCEVIDISLSGAAIKTDVIPALGTCVLLGKMRGRVVRYLESGVAIEFTRQLESVTPPSQMR